MHISQIEAYVAARSAARAWCERAGVPVEIAKRMTVVLLPPTVEHGRAVLSPEMLETVGRECLKRHIDGESARVARRSAR